MNKTLTFEETKNGYVARNGDHTYVLGFNSIDWDVVHYWAYAAAPETIGYHVPQHQAARIAREHFASLQ